MVQSKQNVETETPMLPTVVQHSIDKVIKKEGYVTSDVQYQNVSAAGNYMGELYKVNIKGKTVDGEKETNVFVKKCIPGGDMDAFCSVQNLYASEALFYNEICKVFNELQDQANIPIEDRFKTVKCFEANSDVIILENMIMKGYKVPDPIDAISLKLAELSVQQLAKFHGLSFVFEKKRPEHFNKFLKTMPPIINDIKLWEATQKKLIDILIDNIEDINYKKILEAHSEEFMEKNTEYFFKTDSPVTSLCHGDFKQLNTFIKVTDGEITEVVPIDYQLMRHSCPILDLIFFIFFSTDQKFRRNHMDHLKNLYYETLNKFLQYFKIDAEEVYPRKEFEKNFKDMLDYGLIVSVIYYALVFAPKDDDLELNDVFYKKTHIKLDSRVQERTKEVIDDFTEWGYL